MAGVKAQSDGTTHRIAKTGPGFVSGACPVA